MYHKIREVGRQQVEQLDRAIINFMVYEFCAHHRQRNNVYKDHYPNFHEAQKRLTQVTRSYSII